MSEQKQLYAYLNQEYVGFGVPKPSGYSVIYYERSDLESSVEGLIRAPWLDPKEVAVFHGFHVSQDEYDALLAERDRLRAAAEKMIEGYDWIAKMGQEEMFSMSQTGEVSASDGLRKICQICVAEFREEFLK
jgi:hypothetical protein